MSIQTPDWVKQAVFYQIFPDRFARSERTPHPAGIQFKEWGTNPDHQGFQGGDLYGVIDKLDYLQELGINAIYLCPIFSSASNHRYHTFDYFQVDPLLGGDDALRELLDEAHKRDMKVVLDGVFNHASRGFWQFHHILECGDTSPYYDWFHIEGSPLRPYTADENNPANYAAWWNIPALPKLNTSNSGVRQMIMDVAKHWLEFGIDGWRLDVPNEINDDNFWREFRNVVKGVNPEAYIVGEIWEEAKRWLQGDQFDAVMNYTVAWSSMSFFGGKTLRPDYVQNHYNLEPLDASRFAYVINEMYGWYDWEINYAQLNLLDSHDTARALWIMQDDADALKLCTLFMMTVAGAPCIFYGDEVGISAGNDPYCREAFPWHDDSKWDKDLLAHYKKAIYLRHDYPALSIGTFEVVYAEDQTIAYRRQHEGQTVIVVLNASDIAVDATIHLSDTPETTFKSVWQDDANDVTTRDNRLPITVPARGARVLVSG